MINTKQIIVVNIYMALLTGLITRLVVRWWLVEISQDKS